MGRISYRFFLDPEGELVRCGGEFLPVPFSLVVGGGIVAFCVPRQLIRSRGGCAAPGTLEQ
jgi:hypothetical protein